MIIFERMFEVVTLILFTLIGLFAIAILAGASVTCVFDAVNAVNAAPRVEAEPLFAFDDTGKPSEILFSISDNNVLTVDLNAIGGFVRHMNDLERRVKALEEKK